MQPSFAARRRRLDAAARLPAVNKLPGIDSADVTATIRILHVTAVSLSDHPMPTSRCRPLRGGDKLSRGGPTATTPVLLVNF